MHDIGAIILLIVAILPGMFLFVRWIVRSLKRLTTPGPTYAPMQAMPQQPPPTARFVAAAAKPAPTPVLPLRDAYSQPVVTREATTADFRSQEEALLADEDRSRKSWRTTTSDQAVAPSPTPSLMAGPLFATTPDLIRSLILQEVLGPPLSRRRSHGRPDPS